MSGELKKPLIGGVLTQDYGDNGHKGIDWGVSLGTPVLAAADGVVIKAGADNTGYGNLVVIEHKSLGIRTYYGHLKNFNTSMGMAVKQYAVIGFSGSTGNSTGPHLHFEVRKSPYNWPACVVDPRPYLEEETVSHGQPELLMPGIYRLASGNDYCNVRHAPAGIDIGDVLPGMTVEVLNKKSVDSDGHTWVAIQWIAWVAGEYLEKI